MKNNALLITFIFALLLPNIVSASADTEESNALHQPLTQVYATQYQAEAWGLAMGMRRGDIPYAVDDDDDDDILPLIEFRNDDFFIDGMEAGAHIWQNEHHQINAYTRFRQEESDKFTLGLKLSFSDQSRR